MENSNRTHSKSLLLLIAGIKGAIGSTVALAIQLMRYQPEIVQAYMTTADLKEVFSYPEEFYVAGWDVKTDNLEKVIDDHGVVPSHLGGPARLDLLSVDVATAPDTSQSLERQVEAIRKDMDVFRRKIPHASPVMINLLPACAECRMDVCDNLSGMNFTHFPDLAYTLAAIRSGVPLVNFTPNDLCQPPLIEMACKNKVPLAGRDGKTGQTYFKVVLASALKKRRLYVDGWYSLNILGNADGRNLMDPSRAQGKLRNKTRLLDDILGYHVGEKYGEPTHKVLIDYYPPRGDAKEAWDAIDIKGLFGLPMSLRINFQGRDSILAAPMVMDLANWMILLQDAGRRGPIPELGFYFKKPEGENPPVTFEDQVMALKSLAQSLAQSNQRPR
jgi:myo-inositol-1-phosphate synthase